MRHLSTLLLATIAAATGIAPCLVAPQPAHAEIPVELQAPPGSHGFGSKVLVLSNGNFVVSDITLSVNGHTFAGAVYLYDGRTRQLISTLTGQNDFDNVGTELVEVGSSDFVVISQSWSDSDRVDAGAITWVDGTVGLNGIVSKANSLIGSNAHTALNAVTVLPNGNYVVADWHWRNAGQVDAGAVRLVDGSSGAVGELNVTNSLVGGGAHNEVGRGGVIPLTNGNYVVFSPYWDAGGGAQDIGAATWQSGTVGSSGTGSSGAGATGTVSVANSLVGGSPFDLANGTVTPLTNGNYVVTGPWWDNGGTTDVGAATLGDGSSGTNGVITAASSLVGTTSEDFVGFGGVTALANGNYVVDSNLWHNNGVPNAGAATWRSGAAVGAPAVVSPSNSIVGVADGDRVGPTVALANGNYVAAAPGWDNGIAADVGAVRWGDGAVGSDGEITLANSFHGTHTGDAIGYPVVALVDGNYVVAGQWRDGNGIAVGAATWLDGRGATGGFATPSNSLIGSTSGDTSFATLIALPDGGYAVGRPFWDNGSTVDAGAVTLAEPGGGTVGPVTSANSVVGSTTADRVGEHLLLSDAGLVIVAIPDWDGEGMVDRGAVTVLGPDAVHAGPVAATNSLVGISAEDRMGDTIRLMSDGRFAVSAPMGDNGSGLTTGSVTLAGATGGPMALTTANTVFGPVPFGPMHDRYTTEGAFVVAGLNRVTLLVPESPPTLSTPADVRVVAPPGASTVPVTYPLPTATDNGVAPPVACTPPPGSNFPLGVTTVTCSATDVDGLVGAVSFTVTVSAATDLVSLPPARLLDTRPPPAGTVDGAFANLGVAASGSTLELTVAGRGGVAADAAAVALNVTATEAEGAGFITVFPCGEPRPTASNVNHVGGSTIPNAVVAKVGTQGRVCIFNQTATHLVVDVGGYFPNGTSYHPINPVRLLESRTGLDTVDGQQRGGGVRSAEAVTEVDVAGRAGIPADAGSVVLNVTVTEPAGPGFVTVYPCGEPRPLASSLNADRGATVANLVVSKIGVNGKVCLFNQSATHVVIDANGYFPAVTTYRSINPARLLDSRAGSKTVDGQGAGGGMVPLGTVTPVVVAGRAGVPADASTVVLNVTVTETQSPGFLTVYPCGIDPPLASNVNYEVGTTAPNAVIVKVGSSGSVCLFNSQATHLVVDVNGYFCLGTLGSRLHGATGVDGKLDTGDVPGLVGGEKEHGVGDVDRLDRVRRRGVLEGRLDVGKAVGRTGEEHRIGDDPLRKVGHRQGAHEAGAVAAGGVLGDARRVDGVHPNPPRSKLVGERLGQPDDTVLGGGIVAVRHLSAQASGRARRDDRPTALSGLHRRNNGAHRVPHSLEVDVDDRVPSVVGDLLEVLEADDACVGDGDVDAAERRHRLFGDCAHQRAVAHIGLASDAARASFFDHLRRVAKVVLVGHRILNRAVDRLTGVDDHNVGALLSEAQRMDASLAMGAAGDEDDLALEPTRPRRDHARTAAVCSSIRRCDSGNLNSSSALLRVILSISSSGTPANSSLTACWVCGHGVSACG